MPSRTYEISGESLKFEEIITAALIGISTVAVIQLLGQSLLDKPLIISLYCFAISIPMLAVYSLIILMKPKFKLHRDTWAEMTIVLLGSFGAIVGVGAIFSHFSQSIGISFIVASVVGMALVVVWRAKISEINPPSSSAAPNRAEQFIQPDRP